MDSKNILFRKEGRIGFVTLNRPEVYNALNRALLEELGEVIERIGADQEIGVAILAGAGGRPFWRGRNSPGVFREARGLCVGQLSGSARSSGSCRGVLQYAPTLAIMPV